MVTNDDAELPYPTRRNPCLLDRFDASSHELLHVRSEKTVRDLSADGIQVFFKDPDYEAFEAIIEETLVGQLMPSTKGTILSL